MSRFDDLSMRGHLVRRHRFPRRHGAGSRHLGRRTPPRLRLAGSRLFAKGKFSGPDVKRRSLRRTHGDRRGLAAEGSTATPSRDDLDPCTCAGKPVRLSDGVESITVAFTPLNALNSFIAVARRRSFVAAAKDLRESRPPRSASRSVSSKRASAWPVRDKVVIATKFGFQGGDSKVGMDSRPERIRQVAEASLKRLRPTGSICSTSIASTPTCRWRTSPAPSAT